MTRPAPIRIDSDRSHRRERIFARSQGEFTARTADGLTELVLLGEVGHDQITEKSVRAQLAGAGDVKVKINSPGGDVFEGIGVFNAFAEHRGDVHMEVTGLAASAASIIAMAGDTISVATGGHVMIHNAWALTIGSESDHRAQAALLQKVDAALAGIYAARSGQTVAAISRLMAAETWFSADEAITAGLADSKTGGSANAAARFDLAGIYQNMPAALRRPPSPEILNARSADELKRLLIERAGLTRGAAEKITAGGWPAMSSDSDATSTLCAKLTAAAEEMRQLRNSK